MAPIRRLDPRGALTPAWMALVWVALAWTAGLTHFAMADEDRLELASTVSNHQIRLTVLPEYDTISKSGASLSTFGFGAGILYGFADRWALGAALRQGFSTSGLASAFTAMDLKVAFAITGSLQLKRETLSLGESAVTTTQYFSRGGLRAEVNLSQYYFNGSVGVFPMSGAGLALYYELPSRSFMSFEFGARIDDLTNGSLGFVPIQGIAGLLFWL